MFTWRTGVLAIVIALAIAVVVPSVRVYIAQQQTLAELRQDRDAAQAEVDDLTADVERWNDPAFVIAQARERFQLVFPGETAYTVIDPELGATHAEGSPAAARLPQNQEAGAWYDQLWASIDEAGNGEDIPVPVQTEEPAPVEDDSPSTTVDLGG